MTSSFQVIRNFLIENKNRK